MSKGNRQSPSQANLPRPRRGAALMLASALLSVAIAPGATAPAADADKASAPTAYGHLRSEDDAPDLQIVPEALKKAREAAGVDERVGQPLALDLTFTDSTGEAVELADFFKGDRPVLLQLAYFRCPQLCGEISQGMIRSMRSLSEELRINADLQVLTISFDTREGPRLAEVNKAAVVEVLSRDWPAADVEAGWDHLVSDDLNVQKLTDALGYRFGWIEEAQEYSHPAALVVLTPDGRVSRYLYGTSFDPQTLRLSLIDASEGTITPSLKDVFILNCFDYDPSTGKYTATAYTLMRVAGGAMVLVMASVIGFLLFAERTGRLRRHPMAGTPVDEVLAGDAQNDQHVGRDDRGDEDDDGSSHRTSAFG